jgi:hypothetical protein
MFDDVFDDKQWKTARDNTGLKGGLTEKVSMGDEFKRFQKDKTVAAAKVLQQKIVLYEKQLKERHAREKYYAKLLKVVQDQKTAIEAGIQAAEKPVDAPGRPTPENKNSAVPHPKVTDPGMDDFLNEVVENQKKDNRTYFENTNNDPKVPSMGEARMVYLKLTKEFPTVEAKIKSEHAVITDLLGKCKALQTNPNLQAKPEVAISVAEKIVETLHKIQNKTIDYRDDFRTEAAVVRRKEGRETPATKELDRLAALLGEETRKIDDTDHACRLVLKAALQSLGNNAKAQQILGLLHV